MTSTLIIKTVRIFCLFAILTTLSSCTAINGLKLAVNCKVDEALAELEEAEKGSGLGAQLAILEREAVLREAGRMEEAEAVRAMRESRPGMTEEDKADAEKSILETVENIRNEREKQTGSRSCT